MPELPEVETVRRQLAPAVEGLRIDEIEVLDPRWCDPLAASEFADAVRGRVVERLNRRGKYLDWQLTSDVHMLMHLRMTGTLLLDPPASPPYARVRVALARRTLWFSDPRRFGTGQLIVGSEELERFFAARLGVEPFDERFGGPWLRALAKSRRGPIKPFLLDQRTVAGIGNIYADEALFGARIHPMRPAGSLTSVQYELLVVAIRTALTAGIDAHGASIDDFRHLDGARGSFQDRFLVHRREGEPCPRCATPIEKLVVGGRGTYICRRCQPPPRRRLKAAGEP
jgi:formamidopyrimidine-DNA glycosylase